jgi:hypothetical protein
LEAVEGVPPTPGESQFKDDFDRSIETLRKGESDSHKEECCQLHKIAAVAFGEQPDLADAAKRLREWETSKGKLVISLQENTQSPGESRLEYTWRRDYKRTREDNELYTELLRTEDHLRAVYISNLDPAAIFDKVIKWFYPTSVPPTPEAFKNVLVKLSAIGTDCLACDPAIPDIGRARIEVLSNEAVLSTAMWRKAELIWGFFSALVVTIILLTVFRCLFHLTDWGELLPAVIVPSRDRTALTMVYLTGTAVGAWLSYIHRDMTGLQRTSDTLVNLRQTLADTVHPATRTFYILAFSFIALVLFHTGVVVVHLGSRFDTSRILTDFRVALGAGLLLGLAERTLPDSLMRRAEGLGAGLGSSTGSAPSGPGGGQTP